MYRVDSLIVLVREVAEAGIALQLTIFDRAMYRHYEVSQMLNNTARLSIRIDEQCRKTVFTDARLSWR
jgi:hypothetical protein